MGDEIDMKMPLKLRIKKWFCKILGHRKEFDHHFEQDWYVCKRCRRILGEGE